MEIIVFSDIHGAYETARQVVLLHETADVFLFLGDGEKDVFALKDNFPHHTFFAVKGNNDYLIQEKELLLNFCGKRVYMTHGHEKLKVKYGLDLLTEFAEKFKLDLLLYGHTHRAKIIKNQHTIIMNPGAIYQRKNMGLSTRPSYGKIILTAEKIVPEILNL